MLDPFLIMAEQVLVPRRLWKKKSTKVKEEMRSKGNELHQQNFVAGSTQKSPTFLLDLQKIVDEMDSIKENVVSFEMDRGLIDQKLKSAMSAASPRPPTTEKTAVVGFNSYLEQLLDWVTGQQSDRQIIPITGMGGIGKTTLATNVYEHLLIMQHFDVRAWVTISQEYNVSKVLSEILSCLRDSTSGMGTEDQLGQQLHKVLFGRRYLIVLDDMWSIDAWEKIKFFFPNSHDRSRIIVTTRIATVASHLGSMELALSLLDDEQSWNLFCEKVFGKEICPPELEKIGKDIVKRCGGLPLLVFVIAGLVRKSTRMQEYWRLVAKDLNSMLNSEEGNQCLNILSLSYNHLPAYLKPCFLYFGLFSEDHNIDISNLIKLWVAEGFLKPNKDQSLEKIAEGYVKDLFDRNLILVRSLKSNGQFKTCNIHDLLRDLCVRIAEKEKFFHVMRELDTAREIDGERRIAIHQRSRSCHTLKSSPFARSVISKGVYKLLSESRLLRVLYNVLADEATFFRQFNLRILTNYPFRKSVIFTYCKLPTSISLFWNLQTLIITEGSTVVAPSEIWEMPQLRHLKCDLICLPDPPLSDKRDSIVLRNLETVETIENFKCSEEVCRRIPNIKKLHLYYEYMMSDYYCHCNVSRLNKIESLDYLFEVKPNRDDLLQNLIFPKSVKKLTLENCGLEWNDLRIVGCLPYLEILKLCRNAFIGAEWNPVEGEFLRLKHLRIYRCSDLILWNANNSHFPVLEKLVLHGMEMLDEIPSDIGEIPTLESISVNACSLSTVMSAMRILEEQESLGAEGLQIEVKFRYSKHLKQFREYVEQESFTSLNFQLGLCGDFALSPSTE